MLSPKLDLAMTQLRLFSILDPGYYFHATVTFFCQKDDLFSFSYTFLKNKIPTCAVHSAFPLCGVSEPDSQGSDLLFFKQIKLIFILIVCIVIIKTQIEYCLSSVLVFLRHAKHMLSLCIESIVRILLYKCTLSLISPILSAVFQAFRKPYRASWSSQTGFQSIVIITLKILEDSQLVIDGW